MGYSVCVWKVGKIKIFGFINWWKDNIEGGHRIKKKNWTIFLISIGLKFWLVTKIDCCQLVILVGVIITFAKLGFFQSFHLSFVLIKDWLSDSKEAKLSIPVPHHFFYDMAVRSRKKFCFCFKRNPTSVILSANLSPTSLCTSVGTYLYIASVQICWFYEHPLSQVKNGSMWIRWWSCDGSL